MPKPHMKLLAYHKIYCELNEKYGFKTANAALRALWDGHLYLHDGDTSTFKHYCYAYDLKDLAEKGLFFIDNFNAEPPKHADTFIDFVKEYISYACNRSSGAVGLPNLIPYLYYFAVEISKKVIVETMKDIVSSKFNVLYMPLTNPFFVIRLNQLLPMFHSLIMSI